MPPRAGKTPGKPFGDRFERIVQGFGAGSPGPRAIRFRWWWLAVPFVLLFMARAYVVVPYGAGGVVFDKVRGVLPTALSEGFHSRIPVLQQVQIYDTKVCTYSMTRKPKEGDAQGQDHLQALTSDGQKVDVEITARYRLARETLPELHQAVGPEYGERVIRPVSRAVVRMVCAQHPVSDFTSQVRDVIQNDIRSQLADKFTAWYVTLEDVIIDEVEFSEEFRAAVEEKQRALQEAEQMDYRIQEATGEADRLRVEAEGDAEQIKERGVALQRNPLLMRFEYVKKISPNVKGLMVTKPELDEIKSAPRGFSPPAPRPLPDLTLRDLGLDQDLAVLRAAGDEPDAKPDVPAGAEREGGSR